MFLKQKHHTCNSPRWESTGVVIFEDGLVEFKYDCVARETSKHYRNSPHAVKQAVTYPCGATKRVYLSADKNSDLQAIEMLEAIGSDRDDDVEIVRADPPTPDDSDGLFVVDVRGTRVIYR